MEIITSHDFTKLIVSGKADKEVLTAQWEKIIAKNYEVNGGFDYLNYIDIAKSFAFLLAEQNLVKAQLFTLLFEVDDKVIEELKLRGYKISLENRTEFNKSIMAALKRTNNLNSRMKMKANELHEMISDEDGKEQATFEQVMAALSFQVGFALPEDITLSRYNEYRKIINERNSRKSQPIDI